MKRTIVIVMCFLVCSPAFGRQHKHSVPSIKALSATLTASETDDGDGTSTGEIDDNDEKNDTDDMDTGTTMGMDDQDTGDTKMSDDHETDGMDDDANSVKTAIHNALKALAMKNSKDPLAAVAATLDAGLSPKQTILQMLEPSGTGGAVATLAMAGQRSIASLDAIATSVFATPSGIAVAAGRPSTAGSLLGATLPEPTALSLLAMAGLTLFWNRRRR